MVEGGKNAVLSALGKNRNDLLSLYILFRYTEVM